MRTEVAWFSYSTSNRKPWIIGVTDAFVEDCFDVAVKTVNAFQLIQMETMWARQPKYAQPDWIANLPVQVLDGDLLDACGMKTRTYGPICNRPAKTKQADA